MMDDHRRSGVTTEFADAMENVRIDGVRCATYRVPTEAPESDGTLRWDHTGVVAVHVLAGGEEGLGWTYGPPAVETVVQSDLADVVTGRNAMDLPGAWDEMVRHIRNQGRPGVVSMAISAVDIALWDLKAKLLGLPLVDLLGRIRQGADVYGSGGFTSMDDDELADQLSGWVDNGGMDSVKMKIAGGWGEDPQRDLDRILVARNAVGPDVELFVDANGGYTRKQAVRLAAGLEDLGVTWFEEPVSSDDLTGLAEIRSQIPQDVAAGEYGYHLPYFAHMIASGSVDVVQADITRCGGITEWLRVAALAEANGLDISGHCAQSLHVAVACAVPNARHLEYFADHERIDRLMFTGAPEPNDGVLSPGTDASGHGIALDVDSAERYEVDGP